VIDAVLDADITTSESLMAVVIIIDIDDGRHYKCQEPFWIRICDMRVTKEKAAENRERILDAASRLIRERGISGAGVDALTEAAGMTHGSLYSQFGSKERLVEEALAYALAASGKTTAEAATLDRYVSAYLSSEHRDRPGQGCPLAALVCEMPRQGSGARQTFTTGLQAMSRRLSSLMGSGLKQRQRDNKALATIASLVGALVLARAVNDPKLSDDILRVTQRRLAD
jgi:TetR/AcrR family transcriptional regulator, transcriptional repressor for nem operon